MRTLRLILTTLLLFGCQESIELTEKSSTELKTMALEGINLKFIFKSNNPTFGELYMITGSENPKFPAKNRQFEKLNDLNFSFIDGEYYGIKNDNKIGDGVTLWLFPLRNSNTEYDYYEAPFDSILMEYTVLSNDVKSSDLVKKVFYAFKDNLDVAIVFEEKQVADYKIIQNRINEIIEICRTEFHVEPGSTEALKLVWKDSPLYDYGNDN